MNAIVINAKYALRSDGLLLRLARGQVSIGRGDIVEVALRRTIPGVIAYGHAIAVIERGPRIARRKRPAQRNAAKKVLAQNAPKLPQVGQPAQ